MTELEDKKYVVVKNAVDPMLLDFSARYYDKKFNHIKDYIWTRGELDGDVVEPYNNSYHNDPVTYSFLEILKDTIEKVSEKELLLTYCYTRMYRAGMWLRPHSDRPACEISITMPVTGEAWPIFVGGTSVELEPGDIVVYKGCEVEHWRKVLKGPDQVQLHLHYVDANGPYAWAEGDRIRVNPNTGKEFE